MFCQLLWRAGMSLAPLFVFCGFVVARPTSVSAVDASPQLAPMPLTSLDGPPGARTGAGAAARPDGAPRDPTRASAELRELMALDAGKALPAAPLPVLALRGLVIGSKGDPAAVISLGGKETLIVHAGRQYVLSGGGNRSQVILSVARISADQVEVEVRPTGQKLVLH